VVLAHTKISLITDDEGAPAHFVVHVEDITARRVAEDALRESEERFRHMADDFPSIMWVTGADGAVQLVNRAFREFFGHSCEQLQENQWQLLFHPEDAPRFLAAFAVAVRDHETFRGEVRALRADGQWRLLGVNAQPRIGLRSEWMGHIGLCADITERRKAEQALLESENRFRIMADSCPIGIWVTDAEGGTLFVNQEYRKFAGWISEQIEPEKWKSLIHPEDAPTFFKAFNDALQEHSPFKGEGRFLRADGQWRWTESYAVPRFSQDGDFLGFTGTSKDVANRKHAEQSLRSSEEKFRQLAENIQEVFWIIAPATGEVIYVSRAFEAIWGRSCASLYQSPMVWYEAIHPEDRAAQSFEARKATGIPSDSEFRIRTPDGLEKWIRNISFHVHDGDGELIRVVGIAEDITERKRAGELLRQTADRLELAIRAGAVGVWDWDLSNDAMIWDEQMFRLYGVGRDHFCNTVMEWSSRLHPEDRERALEECRAALRGEREFDTEFRILWPDGSVHSIRALAQVERDANGKPVYMIGTNWDITAQKRTEELLKQTADRLALAASAGGAGIWFRDLVNGWGQWDEQMYRLYGTTKDEFSFSEEAYLALVHPEDRRRVEEELSAAERGEKKLDSQFRIVWPDGSIRHISANALVKWDSSGKPLQIVGTNRDITAQKEAAAALLGGDERLQSETERARESSIRADAANAAKSEFMANMSHEIRTPMNGVIGMVGLLLDTELSVEQRRYAEIARASGESLLQLINDILDFSKIEAKKLELEMVDFDLRILLDHLHSILSATAKAKRIELQWIVDPAVPTQLRGASGRLLQILINLAGNAIKFTEKGEVRVSVALAEDAKTDCLLRFSVRDTGIGIPEDKIGLLFNKFSQVEVSTTRKYGGTGLGLAISKQLAELMGGEIGLTSQAGKGSEFWFTVRLGPSLGRDAQPPGSELQTTANLNGRVLIAEDNSTNQEVALGMIRKLGLRAEAVADGAEALNVLESTPYDLVLMDMRMPVMDGVEATRHIRDPRSAVLNHNIPIIALTANAMQSDRQACLAAGMNDFVSKPIRKAKLRDVLKKWLHTGDVTIPVAIRTVVPPRTVEDTADIFDQAGVLGRLEGDNELAQIVFAAFLEDIPHQIQSLKDLVKSGDTANSARLAHSIKGASANVGGERLRNVALAMEKAADLGNLQYVAARVADMELQFGQLRDAMKANQRS
jgi:PAS domain S-box-containing protein